MSLEDGVSDLYVVLTSEIIPLYLERSYKEFYDTGDSVTDLECMNDDVSRVWRLVEWHDKLAEIDTSLWKFLESDDPNDLELRFKESAWLLRLKKRIEIELKLRELRDGERENKPFEGRKMNEKRFFTKVNKTGRLVIIDKECHIELIDLTLACDVLNRLDLKLKTYNEQLGEQQEKISYWKHRVSTLLFILSQFDNDKVKKLLEELDE